MSTFGKHEQHDLISFVKECASFLRETPSRDAFDRWREEHMAGRPVASSRTIETRFGGWTLAIQAAGLDPLDRRKTEKKPKPISFPKHDTPDLIREIIERSRQKKEVALNHWKRILCIGDTHFPFTNEEWLRRVYERAKKYKPDVIVQVGDLKDMLAASRFPRSLNTFTPEAEYKLGHTQATGFWEALREASPKAECFQLMGNHDVRPLRQILAKWPEGEMFVDEVMKGLYTFEGVKTIHDPTEELIIGDIAFMHGYLSGTGRHRDFSQMNVVHGHTHKGGVSFRPYMGKTLWELDCGVLADPDSAAMAYRNQKKLHDLTPGVGEIDEDGPRFIPFR